LIKPAVFARTDGCDLPDTAGLFFAVALQLT